MGKIDCHICDQWFTAKKNLYAHIRNQHNLEPLEPRDKMKTNQTIEPIYNRKRNKTECKFNCDYCAAVFSRRSSLSKHISKLHETKKDHDYYEASSRKSRLICPHDSCGEDFLAHNELRNHLYEKHKIIIEMEELTFSSVAEFQKWKIEVQKQTLAVYTADTSTKSLINGDKRQYFNCFRSHKYKSKGLNKRRIKLMGSNKMNKACPARMVVTISETKNSCKVNVQFWKTHCGHSIEMRRVTFYKHMRAIITGSTKRNRKKSTFNEATNSKVNDQEYAQNTKNDVGKTTSDMIGEEYILNETNSWIPAADDTIIEFLEDNELEAVPEGPYTWPKAPLVGTDYVEENDELPAKELTLMTPTGDMEPELTDYVCNACNCIISGVRYTCVQCSDYDVCAACEARGVHALHYALRVPEHSEQDEVLRIIEEIRKCLNENQSMIMMPDDEGIKDEIQYEYKKSDVKKWDSLRREEQLDTQAREQEDSTDIHIVPASYAEAVPVETANIIPVHTTNSTPMPVGHAITIPVGHSNSAPEKLIGRQEGGSKDIKRPKNRNLLLPPINKTKITSQNINTMSLGNLRKSTVGLVKRDADGNLVSKVCGKPHLAENNSEIDLKDSNTKKPRYSKGKDKQTSRPARVKTKKLSSVINSRFQQSEASDDHSSIKSKASSIYLMRLDI